MAGAPGDMLPAPRTFPVRVGFLTQHGKETLLGPLLGAALGCTVERATGMDTDGFGTFTREVPRLDTQRSTARKKAAAVFGLGDWPVALASEGAFGTDPFAGMLPWNVEVLVWLDRRTGLDVAAHAQGPAQASHALVGDEDALWAFARGAGFPAHQLVVRAGGIEGAVVAKGIATETALLHAFRAAQAQAPGDVVCVEHDLRAFCNPTRQAMIVQAGRQLIAKLQSCCPRCESPGYWPVRHVDGLPCEACSAPTHLPLEVVWGCTACGHEQAGHPEGPPLAPAARCHYCNP